jgi:hypothetical protein
MEAIMATNIKRYLDAANFQISLAVSHPTAGTAPLSGQPVRVGTITGIALTDKGDGGNAATHTTVNLGSYVAVHTVDGVDGDGNSAVALYDPLYYVDGDAPNLSKKATGVFYGYALGTVASGEEGEIEVMHVVGGN